MNGSNQSAYACVWRRERQTSGNLSHWPMQYLLVLVHLLILQTMSNPTAKGGSGPGPSRSLYISNLSPSVTEYNLVQLFSPYGKISRLDLIFHKSGPLKGKTKGYAFVELSKHEDAIEAKVRVDGRLVGGRKISVGWAVS